VCLSPSRSCLLGLGLHLRDTESRKGMRKGGWEVGGMGVGSVVGGGRVAGHEGG